VTFSLFIIVKHKNRWNTVVTAIFCCNPTLHYYNSLPSIYLISMDPIVLSVEEKDLEGNEDTLIDKDVYVIVGPWSCIKEESEY